MPAVSVEHLLAPIRGDVAVVLGDRDHVAARLGQTGQTQLVRSPTREPEPTHPLCGLCVEPGGRAVGDDELDVAGSHLGHEPLEASAHLRPRLGTGHDDRQAHRGILAAPMNSL
jgi:hypothetical protein